MKVTPSGLDLSNVTSKLCKSADLEGLVRASNMVVLKVRSFKDNVSFTPFFSMYSNTLLISHVEAYLGCGGLRLATPAINLEIVGCWPMLAPSTLS